MNKRVLIITILVCCFQKGFTQHLDTIYVDENFEVITREKFKRKTKSGFFLLATINTDTAVYKKIRFREYYGQLNVKKKHQLNQLFFAKYKIDTTKTWLIHYIDTLPDINKLYKKSGVVLLDSLGNDYGNVMSIKRFNQNHIKRLRKQNRIDFYRTHKLVRSFKDYKKIAKRENRKLCKNKKLEFLHIYGFNKKYPLQDDEFNWRKDENLILQHVFTDGNRMYMNIIVFDDGSFYAHSGRAPLEKQKALFKLINYKKWKKIWLKEYNKITKTSEY
ncbi:MAG: hypothetical protein HKN90_08065 [Flavobacteriaceae bacterium]|nr:hypothetical protein [Flavobacteriaceae bacterium]